MEIRNYDENIQIEPIENDRAYMHMSAFKLLEEYQEIGSVYEFRRLKKESDEYFLKWVEYKKLEEQGLLLRLPCKVGDTVYIVGTKCFADEEPNEEWCESHDCCECVYDREMVVFEKYVNSWILKELVFENNDFYQMGKTVFLTKEEAEQALAEVEK